jgi:hypothetical protein
LIKAGAYKLKSGKTTICKLRNLRGKLVQEIEGFYPKIWSLAILAEIFFPWCPFEENVVATLG